MPAVGGRSLNLRVGDSLKTLGGVLLINWESEVLQPKTRQERKKEGGC